MSHLPVPPAPPASRRILLELFLGAGLVALLLAGPWTEAGPYGWAATLQLKWSGSYSDKVTLLLSIVIWALLGGLGWWTWHRFLAETPGPGVPGQPALPPARSWLPAGICGFGVVLVLVSGLVLAFPPAPRRLAAPGEVAGHPRPWPTTVDLDDAAWEGSPWLDREHAVVLRRGNEATLFLPLRAPGAARPSGLVAWDKASETEAPSLKGGVLTLEPVPLVVRRALEAAGQEAPLFLPTLRPGATRLDVAVLWLIAGLVVAGMGGWLWRKAWQAPAA